MRRFVCGGPGLDSLVCQPISGMGGDFSDSIVGFSIYDPLTTRTDPAESQTGWFGRQFPRNVIPASRVSNEARAWMNTLYDRPNYSADPFYNRLNNLGYKMDRNKYSIKVDHQFNSKDSIWVRYNQDDETNPTFTTGAINTLWKSNPRNTTGRWFHIATPSLNF